MLTALGVGLSTVVGAVIGFIFGNLSRRVGDLVLSFGAGVMLSASFIGLILPAFESSGVYGIILASFGVLLGGALIDLLDKLTPRMLGERDGAVTEEEQKRRQKVILFVLAVAMHNIPEGIASGVAFGTENMGEAILVSASIALQNIPEGMVIISPMISVGISRPRAFAYAALTGLSEVVGAMAGYFAVSLCRGLLPLLLATAGGSMIYVITHEMIPESHSRGNGRGASYALLLGFLSMVIFSALL